MVIVNIDIQYYKKSKQSGTPLCSFGNPFYFQNEQNPMLSSLIAV